MTIIAARRYLADPADPRGGRRASALELTGTPDAPGSRAGASGAFDWIGLCEPDHDEMDRVAHQYGLHPLAVEDALSPQQMPKLDIYQKHLDELFDLLRLPGKARRETVDAEIVIPEDVPPEAPPHGPPTGIDPKSLSGIVIDDVDALGSGRWSESSGLKGYVGYGYQYAAPNSGAKLRFAFKVPRAGRYEIRLAYRAHPNRGTRVPVTIFVGDVERKSVRVNMRETPPLPKGFLSLGVFSFAAGQEGMVLVSTENAGGLACADAVQVLPVP